MWGGQFGGMDIGPLQQGEVVDVFHRYSQEPNGHFMVDCATRGILHPSVGLTDGWTEARVLNAWDPYYFDQADRSTWVEIQWSHPTWYNRRGIKRPCVPAAFTLFVAPLQVRRRLPGQPPESMRQPRLSLLHVRWGGERPVDPVTEGAGGWGQIGSTPSDNYINGWEDMLFQTIGPTYEIISAFIQNTNELSLLSPPLLRQLMRGKHLGALYFSWPISFQDGHEYPAYVQRETLLKLMVQMEATGISTRFPHPAHLYRTFASKEWTMQLCLHPLLRVPLTTGVGRSAVVCNAAKAARTAIDALSQLAAVRSEWSGTCGQMAPRPEPVMKGVAKLGYSWEAMDVKVWQNANELQAGLSMLANQPGSLVDHVLVQEWVDFDVEMRHFVVEPDLADPSTWKPKKIVYTVMKSVQDGSFRDFDRFDREGALANCFCNDSAAMSQAEEQAEVLIGNWLRWIQAQIHVMPTVVRFDILAKRLGPGRATVTTGELTELGGCFLGWPKGPEVVFSAMVRSCFRD
mmetsp:Transcript_19945/g.43497  ORF Transcript_19945/g.43497 Transcript_19945/m.43497 type:complete len:516 (+) Transcript_19945:88-1635(+)|eukprot:CAMPEP_0170610318 /NCGR_PEP_ID=MMETSP0224-20130122/22593_1 /TAXON_ID=285029 /ORGANISM="Togula jolla, Strain CCCM 725" /LENGTH=515 /DNA_ID=CAMNT_0010935681 /DNA_START=21 /DNA_END=1568 /DNA_ORIENTATION=-